LDWEPSYNISKLLERIVERQISITEVMADQVMTSSTEVASLITLVSQAAVQLGYAHVVHELGQAEALGRTVVDENDTVPEARPVLKEIKVSSLGLCFRVNGIYHYYHYFYSR
jgi:DNA-directed RNA polymerase, mitochondrial